ncbi:Cell division protein FtsZ [uncultured Desulfatiglans sp.]|nr:Cell division protein FtsZ [uncultured Desulfatiglans sp.]
MKFEFVEEKERYQAKIKVIGIGGAGGNAINNMIAAKLKGVDLIAANTDCQDLDRSSCPYRIQLGPETTKGLGAGADPEIGAASAEESINEVREAVEGADMVFITAGMGGGTGTGAAPIVARECKDTKALTVAVVSKPFEFEGRKRMARALDGLERLKGEVDSLIVIPNERLKALGGKNASFKDLIVRADDVLLQAVRGISDLIMSTGFINLDFADVKKVMEQNGTAIMGMGRATGENRAIEAAQMAINSPLLEDLSIRGARGLLMNITGSYDMTLDEIEEASKYIKGEANDDADIFFGVVYDENCGEEVHVTVIATGIDSAPAEEEALPKSGPTTSGKREYANVVKIRDISPEEAGETWTVRLNGERLDLDTPTFQRIGKSLPDESEDTVQDRQKKKKGLFGKLGFRENLEIPTFMRVKAD